MVVAFAHRALAHLYSSLYFIITETKMFHGMSAEEFREFTEDVVKRLKTWTAALREHPLYDSDDWNPYVRATCYVSGTESYSIERLRGAYGQFARMSRKHMEGTPVFRIEPIRPADPISEWFVLDVWNFPSKWNRGCEARKRFKELFPRLRKVVNQARREKSMPAIRDPITKKVMKTRKESLREWVESNPETAREMKRCGITVDDIWRLAHNKLTAEDVDRIGVRQLSLFK